MKKVNNKVLTEAEEAELKHNALEVLVGVRKTMLQRFPFVGAVAMSLDLVPVRDVDLSTAATDGKSMYWNIEFLASITPEERLFTFAHEVYHSILMHGIRKEHRDHYVFNIAADLEINNLLEADGIVVPEDVCLIKSKAHPHGFDFEKGLSAEKYYDLLLRCPPADKASQHKLCGQFDKHVYKDDLHKPSNTESYDKYGKVFHDPDYRPNVTDKNAQHIREAAISAMQTIERQGGTVPAHLKDIISKLTEPKVDWKEVLSQFVVGCNGSGDRTWNRCNRRFVSSGIYLPSTGDNQMNVAVVIDTSGSVTEVLPQFLGELNGLVKSFGNYKLTVIQNDAAVQDVAVYDDASPLDLEHTEFEAKGFGGTNLEPAFKHIADNCDDVNCVVVMTDGWFCKSISADICDIPTIWMLTKHGIKDKITFGDVIECDD